MRRARTTTLAGFAVYLAVSLALNSGAMLTVHEVSKPRHPWLGLAVTEIRQVAKPRLADAELDWVELPEEMSHIKAPAEKKAETKPVDELEVALVKPPPKKKKKPKKKPASRKLAVVPATPPKPKVVEKKKAEKKKAIAIQKERRISVEVDDDKNVVNEPPPEAKFWSDKNRRVMQESVARDTNLERANKSKSEASAKSENDSPDVGGEERVIAQLEDAEASSLDAKRQELASVHNGKSKRSKDLMSGDRGRRGDGGDRGDEGDGREGKKPGLLSMRNLAGKTAEGTWAPSIERVTPGNNDGPEVARTTDGHRGNPGKIGKKGKKGRRGPRLRLDNQDYERIMGHDKAREEVEVARRKASHKKGRWAKKLARVRASLENFTPNVRPGNQTALGTRAAPFAVYLSRMHRKIHELWGFGFLSELAGKSAGHPLNDYSLKVKIEIVLLSDGTVDQVTIVRPSPKLTFDVAAVDTVYTAGPFGEPPAEIRSGNGKVYLQWTFHRNEYQCSSYFAEPYILDNAPPGTEGQKRGMISLEEKIRERKVRRAERLSRERGSPTKSSVIIPHVHRPGSASSDPAAAARVNANLPTPDDPNAQAVAAGWMRAFRAGDVDALIALSSTPFQSNGIVVAKTQAGLRPIYETILEETTSRRMLQFKVVSAAGYRKLFGHLPRGVENGTSSLYLVVKMSREIYTLMLTPAETDTYRITGFQR